MERHEQIPARYLLREQWKHDGELFQQYRQRECLRSESHRTCSGCTTCFGRFGWMGKIAGAVLAMMMIGNNVNMNEALASEKKRPAAQSQDEIQQSEIAQGTGGGRRR